MVVTGCPSRPRPADDGQRPQPAAKAELRERALTLWNAKVAEDWPTVFRFEVLRPDVQVTVEDFINYCETEEPFKVHACEVGRVLTDGDRGWVELDVRTSIRRFENAPVVENHRWEKWYVLDGKWMPVPSDELDRHPAAPVERDLAAEPALRARFDEAWQARQEGAWDKLYAMVDPHDRESIPEDTFTTTHNLMAFKSCDVHWVEVIGDRGVIHCTLNIKLTDPSMTKMPVQKTLLHEDWIKIDGQWYIDYQRNSSAG